MMSKFFGILGVCLMVILVGECQQVDPENYVFYAVYSDIQAREVEDSGLGSMTLDTVYLAKNEREGFQLYFRSLDSDHSVRITVEDFKNKDGSVLRKEVFKEHFFNMSALGYNEKLADALIPYNGEHILVGKDRSMMFYVDLRSMSNTKEGTYTSFVRLYIDGKYKQKILIAAVVWNFTLPVTRTSDAIMGLYNSASGYGDTSTFLILNGVNISNYDVAPESKKLASEIVSSYQNFLLDHGITPYEIPRWLIDDDPAVAHAAMSDPRRKAFMIPLVSVYGYNTDKKNFSESAWKNIKQYQELIGEDEELRKKAFFYLVDEPRWNENLERLYNESVEVLNKVWPGFHSVAPFYDSTNKTIDMITGKSDIFCPNQEVFVSDISKIDLARNGPWTKVWRYPGDNHRGSLFVWIYGVVATGIMRRILAWQGYVMEVNGLLFWNAGYFKANPWESDALPGGGGAAGVNGDGILVYPGGPLGLDPRVPIASLRLKQFADGIDDHDYLKLYEKVVGRDGVLEFMKTTVMFGLYSGRYNIFQREQAYTATTCMRMVNARIHMGTTLSGNHSTHEFGEWILTRGFKDAEHPGMEERLCSICGFRESRETNRTENEKDESESESESGTNQNETVSSFSVDFALHIIPSHCVFLILFLFFFI